MTRRRWSPRRGSALILVLLMTLAVAALAMAAIFMASSAGLISRFYDKEREFRLAAESALEMVRSQLINDTTVAVPDTGFIKLADQISIPDALGVSNSAVRVEVYGATTGDTSGYFLPHVTLIARAVDDFGTRQVTRMDLQRESFSRYALAVDTFPSAYTFGPGTVTGKVHTNTTWRSGATSATAGVYWDSLSAVDGVSGTATYLGDTASGGPPILFPRDSTYAWMTTLASGANLSFAPVAVASGGNVSGTRLEFVAFDADSSLVIDEDEGFARIFELETGMDTSRLRVSLDPSDWFLLYYGKSWSDPVVQYQCGAFYYRSSRWHFFTVAAHRAAWAENVIRATGGSNLPSINNPAMDAMNDSSASSASAILARSTARCFPAGSPYLMTSERMTNSSCVVTGTAADVYPFGTAPANACWPSGGHYGGSDTTFTAIARTCGVNASGACHGGTSSVLGSWKQFQGTAVSGVNASRRQAVELPYLWPFSPTTNSASRGVIRATAGPLFVSGEVRGRVTVMVDGAVVLISALTQVNNPADPSSEACEDQVGIVATGNILVAESGLTRFRRVGFSLFSSLTKHFGMARDVAVHANLMSLGGTVGMENFSTAALTALPCPQDGSANSASGCFRLTGGAVMHRYTPLYSGSNTGLRWDGAADRCQQTDRRPPFFPLTNRYTKIRTLEIAPALANNPTKIRALLMRLKGKTL